MNKIQIFVIMVMIFAIISCNKKEKINYPETVKTNDTDDYFGTIVADPYRWLEDDNSAETAEWVKQQNKVTSDFLSKIPYREQLKAKLLKIWDYPKEGAPFRKADKYFVFRNNGLQNQSVLYCKTALDGTETELLDPNKLSENGTKSLSTLSISDDGKLMGYAISTAGSDWEEIFVRNIETKEDLTDNIKWVKFSGISWYKDGFYYNRYPEPAKGAELSGQNINSKIYYHKMGTPQINDILIYENPSKPEIGFSASVSDSKKYLLIYPSESTSGNALYVKEIENNKAQEIK
ncbi:MAG: S9 family peptidase, partial [Bacteroidales bacterium]|nr:S9 family peptidase [Bacteroidales bacterium]